MQRLTDALSDLLARLWPARRKQELLLDLGEHKGWTAGERDAAVARLSEWLQAELCLPTWLAGEPRPIGPWLPEVESTGDQRPPGVGRRAATLARLVAADAKTLANTLGAGPRSSRADHRWLALLARVQQRSGGVGSVVFHHRAPATVTAQLAAASASPVLDAADAMLLLSLVALWQRRRPTHEARGALGTTLSRRLVPKPVASLAGEVMVVGQLGPLLELAVAWGGAAGRTLAGIVLDAALTEAHLAPHLPRRRGSPSLATDAAWRAAVDRLLSTPGASALLGPEGAAVFRFRLVRMAAYAAGASGLLGVDGADYAYVRLALAIDAARAGNPGDHRFPPHHPGYFMLLPQARRRGLYEDG
jgi:hypothetical protein